MKKIYAFLLLLAVFVNTTAAEYNFDGSVNEKEGGIVTTSAPVSSVPIYAVDTVYNSQDAFMKAEGNVCKVATDGCNTIILGKDGNNISTLMYCEDVYGENGMESWHCLEYNESQQETKNVYNTSEEFLKAEGNTCKLATDGCNSVMIWNGELGGMTMMYCEDVYGENGKEQWSCLEQGDNNDDGLTNDEREYNHIKETLNAQYQEQVKKSLTIFLTKTSNYSKSQYNSSIDLLEGILDNLIFSLVLSQPADKEMPENINNQYMMLKLLKFELIKLKK